MMELETIFIITCRMRSRSAKIFGIPGSISRVRVWLCFWASI